VHTQERLARAAVPSQTRPWVRQSDRLNDHSPRMGSATTARESVAGSNVNELPATTATDVFSTGQSAKENGVSEKGPRELKSAVLRPNMVS
jgi:hypothetical protein